MTKILSAINAVVWGAPALLMILGIGISLTLRLSFVQIRLLPEALKRFFRQCLPGRGNGSSFRSLCTALGATVGTGNLVGVAGAISLGGPGAVFWMWICGILGMVTKYAEATLAVQYRIPRGTGFYGGPMYMMTEGIGTHFLPMAKAYSVFGVIAAFGVGNATQVNAVIHATHRLACCWGKTISHRQDLLLGLMLAALLGTLLFGGAKRIAQAAQLLVPMAAAGYILLCLGVLFIGREKIGPAFSQILVGAFDPKAVTGGMLGSAFQALRIGCSRGVFTNEAGMGTASIAHAEADVAHPVHQGLMGIVEVFLDTIVICTLTALVILVSGIPIPYGQDAGAALTMDSFASVYGMGAHIAITAMLGLFAVATILGWSLYGARCAQFLFGDSVWGSFASVQTFVIVLSSVLDTAAVWQFAETVNGLMVIPNLITLAALSPELCRLTKEYTKIRQIKAGGGTYANFHQRKPLRTLSHEKVPSSGSGSQEGR